MNTPQTLGTELFILFIRIFMVGLIYTFLWHVLRVTTRQLRQLSETEAHQPKGRYGKLVLVDAGHGSTREGTVYTLQAITTIGSRHSNNIVLDDPKVSREHARITWRGGQAQLEDAGSRNGTTLNDYAPVSRAVTLRDGDLIHVGDTTLKWLER